MMAGLLARLKLGMDLFRASSLFRNAVFLMMSTAIMSVLGFGFWMFVAHLYSAADIGAASALIAISLLISNLSFLGLNAGLVRFLPGSKQQSRDINAVLVLVTVVVAAASLVYLWLAGRSGFTGGLEIFVSTWWGWLAFIVLMVMVSLNTLTDNIFIANRRAGFHTVTYTAFGVVRLISPLFLIKLGAVGVFLAFGVAATASLLLSFIFMKRAAAYRFWTRPDWSFIRRSRRYTTHNYFSSILSSLPSQVLPSFILTRLRAEAYFWPGRANLLYDSVRDDELLMAEARTMLIAGLTICAIRRGYCGSVAAHGLAVCRRRAIFVALVWRAVFARRHGGVSAPGAGDSTDCRQLFG
jgi:hypothetical protein